jgi:hypothetical protein
MVTHRDLQVGKIDFSFKACRCRNTHVIEVHGAGLPADNQSRPRDFLLHGRDDLVGMDLVGMPFQGLPLRDVSTANAPEAVSIPCRGVSRAT